MSASVIAAAGGHVAQAEPSRWVAQWSRLVSPRGAVLDVAAGGGRHARWFASHGHPVVAVERDPAALAALRSIPGVDARDADLEGAPWPLPAVEQFAAVVVTNYLHRPLWPHLLDAVAPGGVLIYETFAQETKRSETVQPRVPARPGRAAGRRARPPAGGCVRGRVRRRAARGVRPASLRSARGRDPEGGGGNSTLRTARLIRYNLNVYRYITSIAFHG